MPLPKQSPKKDPPATQQQADEYWYLDIQVINANSRSLLMSPLKKKPLPVDKRDKYWRKTFRSGHIVVYAVSAVDPKWSDETFVDILRAWKRGEWRKIDLLRKEDRT